jgi:hypothetical protein
MLNGPKITVTLTITEVADDGSVVRQLAHVEADSDYLSCSQEGLQRLVVNPALRQCMAVNAALAA